MLVLLHIPLLVLLEVILENFLRILILFGLNLLHFLRSEEFTWPLQLTHNVLHLTAKVSIATHSRWHIAWHLVYFR